MLEIRDLVKIYPGPVAALQGVTLEVPRGMFGLLGPNGAGKTTLMRIVSGLLEPTSGTIHFNGEDIVADPRRIRRQLGYLPQDFGFYPHLTGESMLRFLLVLKGVQAPKGLKHLAAELLDRVNLSYAAKRKVKGILGRDAAASRIAQALAGDPGLLIVDEPTAGLDPEERLRFYRLLAELAENRTVLLSTHIVEDISVLCPRMAIMHGGRFVADTTPAEARGRLAGTVFQGVVDRERLAGIDRDYRVTQEVLIEGRHRVRIHVPEGPPRRDSRRRSPRSRTRICCWRRRMGWGTETARATGTPRTPRMRIPATRPSCESFHKVVGDHPPGGVERAASAASWVLFGFLILAGFTIATVSRFVSGDPSLGGEAVHITSVYGQASFQSATILTFGVWFLALSPVCR